MDLIGIKCVYQFITQEIYQTREWLCVFVFASIFVRPKIRKRILHRLDAYGIINFWRNLRCLQKLLMHTLKTTMSRVFANEYKPSCKITSYPSLYEDSRPPHLQVEAVLSPTSEILLDHNTTVSQFVGSKFLQICHLQLETKSHNTTSERLHQRTVRLVQRPTDIFLRARLSQLEL